MMHTEILHEKPGVGRLGRHVEHDPRSRGFAIPRLAPHLRSVRHTRHCAPFDQGNLGACTGNALVGACMTGPLYIPGRELGEEDAVRVYENATRLDRIPGHYPPDDTGSSGLAAAKAAKRMGLIASYAHAFSLATALEALMRGPVCAGFDWFEGFDRPKGARAELVIGGGVRGGHEVVLDELDVENAFVGGTNSWGAAFGAHGRFVIAWETLRKLLARSGDVVVPL